MSNSAPDHSCGFLVIPNPDSLCRSQLNQSWLYCKASVLIFVLALGPQHHFLILQGSHSSDIFLFSLMTFQAQVHQAFIFMNSEFLFLKIPEKGDAQNVFLLHLSPWITCLPPPKIQVCIPPSFLCQCSFQKNSSWNPNVVTLYI